MDKRMKLIIGGAIIAILAIVAIVMNMSSGTAPPVISPQAKQAVEEATQANNAAPSPAPDLSKVPEGGRKPGGKAVSRP